MKVTIIDYGAGNVFSVKAAFERLGKNAILSADINVVKIAINKLFQDLLEDTAASKIL